MIGAALRAVGSVTRRAAMGTVRNAETLEGFGRSIPKTPEAPIITPKQSDILLGREASSLAETAEKFANQSGARKGLEALARGQEEKTEEKKEMTTEEALRHIANDHSRRSLEEPRPAHAGSRNIVSKTIEEFPEAVGEKYENIEHTNP